MKFKSENQKATSFKNCDDINPALYPRLIEIGKRIMAEPELNKLLSMAMDEIIQMSGAERGMIILFDQDGKNLIETARNLAKEDIDHPEFEISHTIIKKVRTEKKPICLRNALKDPTLQKCNSVGRLKLLSVICIPLSQKGEIFGVVYLDNRTAQGIFQHDIYAFLLQFADFISLAAYRALEYKQLHDKVQVLEEKLRGKYKFDSIVGHHPKIVEMLKLLSQITETDVTVLIQGESGTGKELIAQAIHFNSRRKDKPFVPINCGALSENLLESELFGHVKGAFTGAIKDKAGWFESASGGTLFLDEISEMSQPLQVKLLRIVQTGQYSRLGSTEMRQCDVRIVAASSRSLKEYVREGKFREELYYRLHVIELNLPPLRERKSDIPLLAHHFLKLYSEKFKKENLHFSKQTEALLLSYQFPGNVRELENIVQRAVVLTESNIIEPHHLPPEVLTISDALISSKKPSTFKAGKKLAVEAFERQFIIDCLQASKGSLTLAAQAAGMDIKNFHTKMRKYGIDPHVFKSSSN